MLAYVHLAFYIVLVCWYIGVIVLLFVLYSKNSKPYATQFKEKYYKEIPSLLSSAELSYLLYHKVRPEALTSTVLNLINKKELIITPNENGYVLTKGEHKGNLSKLEDFTLGIFLDLIGNGKQVTLSEIQNFCHDYRTNSDFLFQYKIWHKIAKNEVLQKDFFEPKKAYRWTKFHRNVGVLLFLVNILGGYHLITGYLTLFPTWFLMFYFKKTYKRKDIYQEEYIKWLAFKNYLLNHDKDKFIPEFIKPSVVLEVIHQLHQQYPDHLNVDFANQLNEGIKKCYHNANLNGRRSLKKNEL